MKNFFQKIIKILFFKEEVQETFTLYKKRYFKKDDVLDKETVRRDISQENVNFEISNIVDVYNNLLRADMEHYHIYEVYDSKNNLIRKFKP